MRLKLNQIRSTALAHYLAFGAASLVFALIDSFGSAWKISTSVTEVSRVFLSLFFYVAPWYLLVGFTCSLIFAMISWAHERATVNGLPQWSQPFVVRDAIVAALPVLGASLLLQYVLTLKSITAFNNHELGSLVVVLAGFFSSLLFLVSWFLAFAAVRAARRHIERPWLRASLLLPAAAALPILAVGWIIRLNWDGFRILGGFMFAGPGGALVALVLAFGVVSRLSEAHVQKACRGGLGVTVASVALAFIASLGGVEPAARAMQGGLWSKVVISALRAVTDVDRDGYSSLFDGGDCSAWNRNINPSVHDTPGDGIDQNCVGGDASAQETAPPPSWDDSPLSAGLARNLVVVTIEAMRADHLSVYGYRHLNTPNIARLAERSVLFNTFYSGGNATPVSLASLWTSTTPSHVKLGHGPTGYFTIQPSNPWLPELLQRANFATVAVLPDYRAFDPAGWNMGFDRGFSDYDLTTHLDQQGGNFYGFPAKEMVPKACRFFDAIAERRFFLWTHLVEPHAKYETDPQSPKFGDDEEGLYASDVWAADREIGHLIECLEQKQLMNNTIVVLTGDHGEGLGDHGVHGHHHTLFEPEVRTLGLMYVPGVGRMRIDTPVVHEDLAPTLMNLLGVHPGFDSLRGRNLVPALKGLAVSPSTFFIEMQGFNGRMRGVGLVDFPLKLVHSLGETTFALYDVVKDPGETTDVSLQYQDVFQRLRDRTISHLETAISRQPLPTD